MTASWNAYIEVGIESKRVQEPIGEQAGGRSAGAGDQFGDGIAVAIVCLLDVGTDLRNSLNVRCLSETLHREAKLYDVVALASRKPRIVRQSGNGELDASDGLTARDDFRPLA